MGSLKKCFIISPLGEKNSPTRKRSDDLRDYIIKPVLEELNIIAERTDTLANPGNITTEVIIKINEADIVIADLTDRNPNVFYELALAHALRKPVIHMSKRNELIPFDVNQYRYVTYDNSDLAELEPTKKELMMQIKNIPKTPEDVINPFTEALGLMRIDKTGIPTEKIVAEIRTMFGSYEARFNRLENLIGSYPKADTSDSSQENLEELYYEFYKADDQTKELSRELNAIQNKPNKNKKDLERLDSLRSLHSQSLAHSKTIMDRIERRNGQQKFEI